MAVAKKIRFLTALVLSVIVVFSAISFADSPAGKPIVHRGSVIVDGKEIKKNDMLNPILILKNNFYYPVSENDLALIGLEVVKPGLKEINLKKRSVLKPSSIGSSYNYVPNAYYSSDLILKISGRKILDGKSVSKSLIKVGSKEYMPLSELVMKGLGYAIGTDGLGIIIDTKGKKHLESYVFKAMTISNQSLSKFVMKVNRGVSRAKAVSYVKSIDKASRRYSISKSWITAIIWKESRFNNTAARSGAMGLMQMMVSTGRLFGYSKADLLVPEKNIDLCVRYLSRLGKLYNGDMKKATLAYNQGSYRVSRGIANTSYLNDIRKKNQYILGYVRKNSK